MISCYWQKKLFLLAVACSLLALSGCVYLMVGSVGALGGYIVSPDTVEGFVSDQDVADVMEAAVQVISVMGVITERNDAAGIVLARAQGARITITVLRLSPSTVRLSVKARKALLPKVHLAQDVYIKTVSRLLE